MGEYTVSINAIDLTPRHIGRRAVFASRDGGERRLHEGRVNNIRFDIERIIRYSKEPLRDIISADVLIGDEWYPLTHVRFAETPEPWGRGNA